MTITKRIRNRKHREASLDYLSRAIVSAQRAGDVAAVSFLTDASIQLQETFDKAVFITLADARTTIAKSNVMRSAVVDISPKYKAATIELYERLRDANPHYMKAEFCKSIGISQKTFLNWNRQYLDGEM